VRPVGHARERAPGRWQLKVYAGRDPLNPARKLYETRTVTADGQREANRQLATFAAEVVSTGPAADISFGELLEKWFALAGPRMVPAGRLETRRVIDTRLRPLHGRRLAELGSRTGTAVLDEFYAALRARGGVCRRRDRCAEAPCRHGEVCTLPGRCPRLPCEHGGGQPLDDATVVRTAVVVRSALEQAVKWGYIDRNPAAAAFAGEPCPDEVTPPAPADVVRLFELAEQDDPELAVLLVLASTTGQRKGRVLGLSWNEVDLDAGVATFGHVLSVGASGPERVKAGQRRNNKKGRATIVPLDPSVVAILLAHRARAQARAAAAGGQLGLDAYVFASDALGRVPLHPRTLSRRLAKLHVRAGLTNTRLHDLRHFVVSYLLKSGVDLATVKALVGHAATSTTTVGVYGHADMEQRREATGLLARLLDLSADEQPLPPDDAKVVRLTSRRSSRAS
jgi:integrase